MKKISLTKGQVALVDDEDYEYFSQFKWQAHWDGFNFYAQMRRRDGNKRVYVSMHREILKRNLSKNFNQKLVVDHINHNGLDNRKENLRLVLHRTNTMNRRDKYLCSSIYSGVYFHQKKYMTMCQFNGKQKYLGIFDDEIQAAIVYMQAAFGPNYLYE